MTQNPGIALMQMESALNVMQNSMVNEDGTFNLDEEFFRLFDELMQKLQETREIAQTLREKEQREH